MSSPLVTQFRRGGVSREVRLTAATGALPLAPSDQVELLYLLTRDSDEEVSETAEAGLTGMDSDSLVSVLRDASTAPDVLAFFAERGESEEVHQAVVRNAATLDESIAVIVSRLSETNLEFVVVNQTRILRHPPILTALEGNENLNSDQRRRIDELKHDFKLDKTEEPPEEAAPVLVAETAEKLDLGVGPSEDEEPPPESTAEMAKLYGVTDDMEGTEEEIEEKKSLFAELATMTAAEKMMRALKGDREARLMLVRDRKPHRVERRALEPEDERRRRRADRQDAQRRPRRVARDLEEPPMDEAL